MKGCARTLIGHITDLNIDLNSFTGTRAPQPNDQNILLEPIGPSRQEALIAHIELNALAQRRFLQQQVTCDAVDAVSPGALWLLCRRWLLPIR
jgi:hypothetical protein